MCECKSGFTIWGSDDMGKVRCKECDESYSVKEAFDSLTTLEDKVEFMGMLLPYAFRNSRFNGPI